MSRDHSRRLATLEQARNLAQQRQWRANRNHVANEFRELGDPRDDREFFVSLTPAWQRIYAWRYEAFKADPAGFLAGVLPHRFAPEPLLSDDVEAA